MSVVLSVKMDVACDEKDFEEVITAAFPPEGVELMRSLPTLQWKIWGVNQDRKQATGIYLFASRDAAEEYRKMAVKMLQKLKGIYNVTTDLWTIREAETHATKGPIDLPQISELGE